MAWRKRFSNYRGRARAWGGRRMAGYRKRGGARGIAGMSLPYIAGAVIGYAGPRVHPMQDMAITAAAVLPIRLPYGIQNIAKGYVFGMIAKSIMPGLGEFGSSGSSSNFV
jgi:hypothetical protein